MSLTFKHTFAIATIWLSSASWASITVPAGSTLSLPAGAGLDLACGDVSVSGSLALGNATLTGIKDFAVNTGGALTASNANLTIAGNFSGSGQVSTGSSSLTVTDGCATTSSQLSGNLVFQNLNLQSGSGKGFSLAPNTTLTITGILRLTGTLGQPVTLGALVGARIVLMPGATVITTNGTVSAAVERSPGPLVAVPVMGGCAMLLLALSMLAGTVWATHKKQLLRESIKS